jgi:hypothetical protein
MNRRVRIVCILGKWRPHTCGMSPQNLIRQVRHRIDRTRIVPQLEVQLRLVD